MKPESEHYRSSTTHSNNHSLANQLGINDNSMHLVRTDFYPCRESKVANRGARNKVAF